jgi:hypothetical protein
VGLGAAFGLMARTWPYAAVRFVILLAYAMGVLVWLFVMIEGAKWCAAHLAPAVGVIWFVVWLVAHGLTWRLVLRYSLYLTAYGHIAVLTELITRNRVGSGAESMFTYGRRIVSLRFADVTVLFGLQTLVRGALSNFHRTVEWLSDLLPVARLEFFARVIIYLEKMIFSYDLARNDTNPWRASRDGLIYYCQNAKPILRTVLWITLLDILLSVFVWIVILGAILLSARLWPHLATGYVVYALTATLLAGSIRAAFLQPTFMIMIMVRFHALAEGQVINLQWDERLEQISRQFRHLWPEATSHTS